MADRSKFLFESPRPYPIHPNKREQRAIELADSYSPADPSKWAELPTNQDEALDALALGSQSGKATVSAVWDASVNPVTGLVDLDASVPANARIIKSHYEVLVAMTGATDADLEVEGTDLHADVHDDVQGTFAASPDLTQKLSADAPLQINIAGTATAGKIKFWVEYLVSE